MKRGFTLLELIVVIIIIGILATLGFTQYTRLIEKSRGAEARAILGSIRSLGAAYRLDHANSLANFTIADAGIGPAITEIPSACRTSHFFRYGIAIAGEVLTATATRCVAGENGKLPPGANAFFLTLTADYANGTDAWASDQGY